MVTAVVHPRMEQWEYRGLQDNAGWELPIEFIDGEGVVTEERRPEPSWGAVQGAPELVIEVLSKSTRATDLGRKREIYLASGVRELWLVDLDAETVTVARPGGTTRTLTADETLETDLLSGFSCPLSAIFRR